MTPKKVEEAAVLIELLNIRKRDRDSGEQTRKHTGYAEEMYNVRFGFGLRLVWIGARGLPPEKISDDETDTMKEASAAAVEKPQRRRLPRSTGLPGGLRLRT